MEYSYPDFLDSLNDTGKLITGALCKHIAEKYPEYKPNGILPKNKN
jgi:hypothetical protein